MSISADASHEPEGPALRVFEIEEKSSNPGPHEGYSRCWVTKESDGFYLYGNELGCMAGPCASAHAALNVSMFQFGMEEWRIRCHLPVAELAEVLSSRAFILDNAARVTINGVGAPTVSIPAIVECYKQWQRKQVLDFTIIIGPPGAPDVQQRIEKRHEATNTPRDLLWAELVHAVLDDLKRREAPDEPSALDTLFSDLLKTPVTVHDVFLTCLLLGGTRHPALRFHSEKISGSTGWPVDCNWSEGKEPEVLARLFGILLKSEWVRAEVARPS